MHKVLVDTNVILRCLLRDNEEHAKKADEVIKAGAWMLPEVLAEVDHVLRTFYRKFAAKAPCFSYGDEAAPLLLEKILL